MTGSDILSSLVLPEIVGWCLVFHGVGMLSITLSTGRTGLSQGQSPQHHQFQPLGHWGQSDHPERGHCRVGWVVLPRAAFTEPQDH